MTGSLNLITQNYKEIYNCSLITPKTYVFTKPSSSKKIIIKPNVQRNVENGKVVNETVFTSQTLVEGNRYFNGPRHPDDNFKQENAGPT